MKRFNTIFNMSDTIENFERDWDLWTKDNNIQNNALLESMFQIKRKWNNFFGGAKHITK